MAVYINGVKVSDDDSEDRGLVISGNTGPVHFGDGDIVENTTVISGDGLTIVNGDNKRGVSRTFDTKKKRR